MTQVDLNFISRLRMAEQRMLLNEAASLLRFIADGNLPSDQHIYHAKNVAARLEWAGQINNVMHSFAFHGSTD